MTHAKHHHSHQHDSHSQEGNRDIEEQKSYWRRAHRDWKFWVAVSLMITAMFVYVMTFDLSLQPNSKNPPQFQQPVP